MMFKVFSLILNSFRPEMGHAAHGTYPYQVSLDDLSLALGEVEAIGFVFFLDGIRVVALIARG